MRTSFHHQPEAQHPHSPAIYTPAGRLPHLLGQKRTNHLGLKSTFVRFGPKADKTERNWIVRFVPIADSCTAANSQLVASWFWPCFLSGRNSCRLG
jgi:hypothetical protein